MSTSGLSNNQVSPFRGQHLLPLRALSSCQLQRQPHVFFRRYDWVSFITKAHGVRCILSSPYSPIISPRHPPRCQSSSFRPFFATHSLAALLPTYSRAANLHHVSSFVFPLPTLSVCLGVTVILFSSIPIARLWIEIGSGRGLLPCLGCLDCHAFTLVIDYSLLFLFAASSVHDGPLLVLHRTSRTVFAVKRSDLVGNNFLVFITAGNTCCLRDIISPPGWRRGFFA